MRRIPILLGAGATALFTALLLAPAPSATAAAPQAADGAKLFGRCAACHTANGAGVPGAFPPFRTDFRKIAAQPQGRTYLPLVVIKGLSGPITVDGKPFKGMMPPQTMDDASVAAVLNHIGTNIAKSGPTFRPFTAAEVAKVRAAGTTRKSADVARMRPGSGAE